MSADFKIIDYMNLHPKRYPRFDGIIDRLFPNYQPYDLDIALGTHTVGWSMEGRGTDSGRRGVVLVR